MPLKLDFIQRCDFNCYKKPKENIKLKNLITILILLLLSGNGLSQVDDNTIWMRPNAGQWHENIVYKIKFFGGEMYLENQGFTYAFNNFSEIYEHGHGDGGEDHGHNEEAQEPIKGHAVKIEFIGSNKKPTFKESNPSSFYENYFLGSDSSKWKAGLNAYGGIEYQEIYKGIDLKIHQQNGNLKYDYILQPGIDPNIINVKYSGHSAITIEEGILKIKTPLGSIEEGKPKVFQIEESGIRKEILCDYILTENIVSFDFPEGFDPSLPLIIDPDLTFSTFTGSSADNWGMTACPDVNKNLIAGGVVFGSGYPLTAGAFDPTYSGGNTDLGITKFTADGTGIIFSTYLGGEDSETPHSLIVNDANELYIMGATGSNNFPITGGAYQSVHGGGSPVEVNGIDFSKADIYLVKLNPNGTALIASTYLGGSSNDGISTERNSVTFNYGDEFRGEVILDNASNVYIASTTRSSNFPTVNGFDNTQNGVQDGIAAKFNPGLTALLWGTYVGGSGAESGNSIQVSSTGDVYVAGGTTSIDFPSTTGQINPSFLGGLADGYVLKFNAPNYDAPKATYLGTTDYDQAYFVQLDLDDFVYLYGQTRGAYPVSPGRFGNPNSGQFIHKLSNDLTSSEWSSTFGSGSGNEELSPTAFLVSDCYEIYVAGWGGQTNSGSSAAANSSSSGMPITADAFQNTTTGSNFYLGLFTKDMVGLKYGTYMGSINGSSEHVDGGTSRFDKGGGVYHAVCAACGGANRGFPTTPGVFSETNNSPNCNLAGFLFELSKIDASLGTASPIICIPDPVIFENDSENGDTYLWDFGDGIGTSTEAKPEYFYTNPGNYTVRLVVSDASGCYEPDTAYIDVLIQSFDPDVGALSDTICPGASVELYVIGGSSYIWAPAELLDNPTSSNPIATITETTTFTVEITSDCGTSSVDVIVEVYGQNVNVMGDTIICTGETAPFIATGGEVYQWTPAIWLDDPTSGNPIATPLITTTYYVDVTTKDGCLFKDTVKVNVDQSIPNPSLIDEVNLCKGSSIQVTAAGARSYSWLPDYNISATDIYNPIIFPEVDTSYFVVFSNACGDNYDTLDANVVTVDAQAFSDTTICPEGTATLYASGGVNYKWSPTSSLITPNEYLTKARPKNNITYSVLVTDEFGCSDVATVSVNLHKTPSIKVSPTVYAILGDTSYIWADGPGGISWSPPTFISCVDCPEAEVWPSKKTFYTATVTDKNGCKNEDVVEIHFDPLIYVPNTFTPDGDQFNENFQAITNNISEFKMYIFNRWGEVIKIITDPSLSWDGRYNGVRVKDDVYVWRIEYSDLNGIASTLLGHVSVLR